MEAKILELHPVKTYIDRNHLDEPIKGKLLIDFIADMTSRRNRTESYKSQYNVLAKHIRDFSEKNFFRYIKIGREENAKNISTDLFFRK